MKPYYDDGHGILLYHGDCRDVLPTLGPVDAIITDPPYGIRKAGWDDAFPTDWLPLAARIASQALAVMPGVNNVLTMPRAIEGFVYRWMLSIQINNGMTRGLMGFGNWIPVVVYGREGVSLSRPQRDCTEIAIVGHMPDHPSPKPLRAMSWLITRFAAQTLCDPFCGSGTTLRAAKDLGRKAIGIELEERYLEVAVRRLEQEVLPLGEVAG